MAVFIMVMIVFPTANGKTLSKSGSVYKFTMYIHLVFIKNAIVSICVTDTHGPWVFTQKTMEQLKRETQERIQWLKQEGYTVYEIAECQ